MKYKTKSGEVTSILHSELHIVEDSAVSKSAVSDLNQPAATVEQARAVLEPHQDKNSIKNSEPKHE